ELLVRDRVDDVALRPEGEQLVARLDRHRYLEARVGRIVGGEHLLLLEGGLETAGVRHLLWRDQSAAAHRDYGWRGEGQLAADADGVQRGATLSAGLGDHVEIGRDRRRHIGARTLRFVGRV